MLNITLLLNGLYFDKKCKGYDQFGISRKGPQDTTDEHCTIFYDKEKVWDISVFYLFIYFL